MTHSTQAPAGNLTVRHDNTAILSVTAVDAPIVVTSDSFDEQLAETYDRVGFRAGMLSQVAGIVERRWWTPDVSFADAAAMAGAQAITESGIDPSRIALLIDYLGLPRPPGAEQGRGGPSSARSAESACMNFDLSNACLGFVNGMQLAATMIDSGQIEYALVVDGEGSRRTQELTLERLAGPEATLATSDVTVRLAHAGLRRCRDGAGSRPTRIPRVTASSVALLGRRPSTTRCAWARSRTCAPTPGRSSTRGCVLSTGAVGRGQV